MAPESAQGCREWPSIGESPLLPGRTVSLAQLPSPCCGQGDSDGSYLYTPRLRALPGTAEPIPSIPLGCHPGSGGAVGTRLAPCTAADWWSWAVPRGWAVHSGNTVPSVITAQPTCCPIPPAPSGRQLWAASHLLSASVGAGPGASTGPTGRVPVRRKTQRAGLSCLDPITSPMGLIHRPCLAAPSVQGVAMKQARLTGRSHGNCW